ncbi:MAG: DUF429 domain-containing protein [Anaerolineales bacterium]|nr:DUF429 domain-containing protein [Anaerolineales bacterium]
MKFAPELFCGIDLTGGENECMWAILTESGQVQALGAGTMDAALEAVQQASQTLVAVNAPAALNRGLVRQRLLESGESLRGAEMRLAEYELRQRGILVAPTPSRLALCSPWVQAGFLMHQRLAQAGFVWYPDEQAARQRIETNAHAVFSVLLGRIPLPRPTLEGRLQRQAALYQAGLDIPDPMDFFEEITRHKLLLGQFPSGILFSAVWLDVLATALTAWYVGTQRGPWLGIGDVQEGQVILPVGELKAVYMQSVI